LLEILLHLFLIDLFGHLNEDKEDYIAVPFKEDPKEEIAATLENNS